MNNVSVGEKALTEKLLKTNRFWILTENTIKEKVRELKTRIDRKSCLVWFSIHTIDHLMYQ